MAALRDAFPFGNTGQRGLRYATPAQRNGKSYLSMESSEALKANVAVPTPAGALRFLLGDKPINLDTVDPTLTVLQWLRSTGRVGTKEGCAEGDCGACTVVLGEPDADRRMQYRAVNACIMFMPVLHGKQLLTVEDVAEQGRLHPVQQSMVDVHASQCGFCTPGFVMSLFALFHQPVDGATGIHEALAGNLCRCTGYRPIVEAGKKALGAPREDHVAKAGPATIAALEALHTDTGLHLQWKGKQYFAPRTLAELARLLRLHPSALLLAGGTDIGLWVTKQHRDLPLLIHLGDVAEMRLIAETAQDLTIGAAASYADILPHVERHWPSFGELLRRLGSTQIRNSGTMGGNIANGSPIGDSMPALIALGARIDLCRDGGQRSLALEDFFIAYRQTALQPGEFVARIHIPLESGWRFATYKLSKRLDQDISAVALGVAVRLDGDRVVDVRIALGGMAATPKRAIQTEAFLCGKTWTGATVAAAAGVLRQEFLPLSDMRASGEYRALAAGNLLQRFYLEGVGEPVRLGSAGDE